MPDIQVPHAIRQLEATTKGINRKLSETNLALSLLVEIALSTNRDKMPPSTTEKIQKYIDFIQHHFPVDVSPEDVEDD
jgi:hypothetical protein